MAAAMQGLLLPGGGRARSSARRVPPPTDFVQRMPVWLLFLRASSGSGVVLRDRVSFGKLGRCLLLLRLGEVFLGDASAVSVSFVGFLSVAFGAVLVSGPPSSWWRTAVPESMFPLLSPEWRLPILVQRLKYVTEGSWHWFLRHIQCLELFFGFGRWISSGLQRLTLLRPDS
jgi:hypothetical protein